MKLLPIVTAIYRDHRQSMRNTRSVTSNVDKTDKLCSTTEAHPTNKAWKKLIQSNYSHSNWAAMTGRKVPTNARTSRLKKATDSYVQQPTDGAVGIPRTGSMTPMRSTPEIDVPPERETHDTDLPVRTASQPLERAHSFE